MQDFFPELYATKEFFSVKEFFPPGVSFLELFSFEISLWDIFFYGIRSEEQLPLIMFFLKYLCNNKSIKKNSTLCACH